MAWGAMGIYIPGGNIRSHSLPFICNHLAVVTSVPPNRKQRAPLANFRQAGQGEEVEKSLGILTFQLGTFGELFKFLSLQHALWRERKKKEKEKPRQRDRQNEMGIKEGSQRFMPARLRQQQEADEASEATGNKVKSANKMFAHIFVILRKLHVYCRIACLSREARL